ncbi:MAG: alanine racemase [Brockia lithotrophica]|nr:alanine racemase [Brockia lithotrophica]
MDPRTCRASRIELDADALRHNVLALTGLLPRSSGIMAVVKANAYGHGVRQVAPLLAEIGVSYFAVATLSEALEIRTLGVDTPILVLGPVDADCLPDAQAQGIAVTVFDPAFVPRLRTSLKSSLPRLKVHVKVDTGMHRWGIGQEEEVVDVLRVLRELPKVEVEGIYTHLARADEPDVDDAERQHERFARLLARLDAEGLTPPLRHVNNSAGFVRFPDRSYELVRLGISLYGVPPSPRIASSFAFLRPVLRLAAPIAQLHLLAPGETAGYGGGFEARRPTRLAVVPLGYGDGIFRALGGGRGEALVRGRRVPIVGRVSMDALFVDVTDVPEASVGDSVVFLGTQGTESISPWEVADRLGTIAYEVLTQLGPRLARVLRG